MFGFISVFNKGKRKSIDSGQTRWVEDEFEIDVRGQTCAGYMLAVNKAIASVNKNTVCRLLISYPPCGEDIESYCRQKKLEYISFDNPEAGLYIIKIRT